MIVLRLTSRSSLLRAFGPARDLGFAGPFAVDGRLGGVEYWETPGIGPADVLPDEAGRVFCGLEDGRILRFPPDGGAPEPVADTGGRPLGLEWDVDGALLVADARRGLLRIRGRQVEVLADRFEGQRLRLVAAVAAASDGTLYFTEASRLGEKKDVFGGSIHNAYVGEAVARAMQGDGRLDKADAYFRKAEKRREIEGGKRTG